MKNGSAVFVSYLSKGDICVLKIFELKFMLITNLTHFLNAFISLLYVLRATQCSSSGESIVSIHHLVYITLCRWSETCIPDGHLHRVIYTRWCIDKIDTPDDEHCVARNMLRSEISTLKKKCVKLVINTNCTEMHGQQNIKFLKLKSWEKEWATETCWRIYVSGLVCIPLCY